MCDQLDPELRSNPSKTAAPESMENTHSERFITKQNKAW